MQSRSLGFLRNVVVVLAACLACQAWGGATDSSRFQAERVVVFGDVHGAYGRLRDLLMKAGITDAEGHWQAGETHLVSLGDLLDRGPDSRKAMDLLRRLQGEAAAAGGRVHVVLGNHELMNLTGDLRYVSAEERAALADLAADGLDGVNAAFAADGVYGSWLLQQPAVVVVNDSAFVHGGLSSLLEGRSVERLNRDAADMLRELLALRAALEAGGVLSPGSEVNDAADQLAARLAEDDELPDDQQRAARRFVELARDPLFGGEGPFWYRGNASCPALIEQPPLRRVLAAWGVARVVVGHTPTPDHRVLGRLDGAVVLADTGMLASYYGGRASAVVIEADGIHVVYADGPASTVTEDDGGLLFPLAETEVLAKLASTGRTVLADADRSEWYPLALTESDPLAVKFERRGRQQRNAELAALRLDRLLGLGLVAPVVELTVGRDDGVVTALWPGAVSEAERAAAGLAPPNTCAMGNAFDLLYAFDALIGNEGRSAQNMVYDRRTWRLGSIDHGDGFGRGERFPAYVERTPQRLPQGLARRLRELDEETLQAELGDLLDERRIRALLARRDALLATWQVLD
ncbi:MAG: metallophosphoesterase [Pseudomonadales bacterium]